MEHIITSPLLEKFPEIVHGISTKSGGKAPFYNNMSRYVGDELEDVLINRAGFYKALGINTAEADFVHANQVHSANAAVVSRSGLIKDTDALITDQKNLFLVISVADCLPVMLYDSKNKVIANIHSGWRGTSKKITGATINKMMSKFGTDPQNLTAFIGPGISCDKFEVGTEVSEQFDKKYVNPFFNRPGKFSIDLKQAVRDEMLWAGVNEENIDTCAYCTFSEKDYLHSYRREGTASGRMFAVIGMRQL